MQPQPSYPPSSAPFSAAPVALPRTLAELDDRLAVIQSGVLVVRVPAEAAEGVVAHVARRLRGRGSLVVEGRARAGAPLWRDVASRLAQGKLPSDPSRCAEQIASAATLRRAVVVARMPAVGGWDRAVTVELSASQGAPLIVLIASGEDTAADVRGERYEVTPRLDAEDRRRWWNALADEGRAEVTTEDLASLEAWWSRARREPAAAREAAIELVPERARGLLAGLALVARPWAPSRVAALGGDAEAVAKLVELGAVVADDAWVSITPEWEAGAVMLARGSSRDTCESLANALIGMPDPEPWAFARAAELLLQARKLDAADRAHARATELANDALSRREMVARWIAAVEGLEREAQLDLRMRGATRALTAGESDEALRWTKGAAALAPNDPSVALLLGRASASVGDLVAAKVAFEHARGCANDAETTALVSAELAELAYIRSDAAKATTEATSALEATALPSTRLKARNTLGKLLLAAARWDDADQHFAEDELLAASHHDVTGELRARLNRGIALLSKGLMDEARAVFEHVLREGERLGEARACAYALSNLGVLTIRRHEYGEALGYMERTIKRLHVMHDRMAGARALANIAALREHLGLFDHAEHAITFGRRTLGPGMTAGRASHFGVVAARVALARGRTQDAQREIEMAIVEGQAAGDQDFLGESYRVAARVALEDGDLPRAVEALTRAREIANRPDANAEVALLRALYERAAGNEDVLGAQEALSLARSSGNEALLREAHVLLANLFRAAGNVEAARVQLDHAARLRDKVADSLPQDVRAAFLARPDIVTLGRLHAQLAEPAPAIADISDEEAPRSMRAIRPAGAAPREIVGDDPAIRGLLAAIKKVARANNTVLIRGESGTGKELVAEALHRASDRANGPLVTVNCAALVETLLLSELFGHEKGAFTGAFARRRGRFEMAEGGTLFLDEIGDISPRTQVALLRVLQERTFERVGGTTPIRANVRIVCATHRDLRAMVERGEFREDLYYRLRGITLEVPALRARMGDVGRISQHLLRRIAAERGEEAKSLAEGALDLLSHHRWPGNIRELENALRAASLFAEGGIITAADLVDNVDDLRAIAAQAQRPTLLPSPVRLVEDSSATSVADPDDTVGEIDAPLPAGEAGATQAAYAQVRQGGLSLSDMKRQIERDCIARALAETKGNITRAAALLGMKRPRLSQLVKQYGLAAVSSEAS